ncbi:thioesterase family protein [Minicystis rosea]|nr:thioesterase family protein [Minicystis rosea]
MVRAMDFEMIRRLAEDLIPFNRFLGLRVTHVERGRVEMEIPWRDELIGDPMKPAVHGGVISMLADTAGGMAIWTALESPAQQRVSTIDLRIDYLRPGRLEALLAEAVVVRAGRSVGVTDMRIYHPSARTEIIATGKGVYSIKTPRTPAQVKQ